jgi:glycosyltransferase involved in cell wall biosynthesis
MARPYVRVTLRAVSGASAIFVVGVTTAGQRGPVAALMSTAGWAAAAKRVLGQSWIATPSGVIEPDDARAQGSAIHLRSSERAALSRRIPTLAKTALKDVRQWRRARTFEVDPDGPWRGTDIAFVWQRHELFHTTGIELARALDVPSVLFVAAPLVWEARQWNVQRPWGNRLERMGERKALVSADIIACGSDVVASEACRIGAPSDRVIVTPTGVDLDLFAVEHDRHELRRRHGIDDRFVVGWVGSFRRYHAIELAVDAAIGLEGVTLLFIGDGPERARIEARAAASGVSAVFTGTVLHSALPEMMSMMDVAVSLASEEGPNHQRYHYSPLKLAEYLAAGLPVIAPAVPQFESRLRNGVDAILVAPGNADSMRDAIVSLQRDPALCRTLEKNARDVAVEGWSWDRQVRRIVEALESRQITTSRRGDR